MTLLRGSWDLVTRVIIKVSPIKVLITVLTKSHEPPSTPEPEKVGAWVLDD